MERYKPLQVPYGDCGLILDYASAHFMVEALKTAVVHMKGVYGDLSALKMQLPLPLHRVLLQITGVNDANSYTVSSGEMIDLFGVQCVAGYEARIIIYNPREAFYNNVPVAVIDFETKNGVLHTPELRFL